MPLNPQSVDIWDGFTSFSNPPWIRLNVGGVGRNPGSLSIQENWDFPASDYALRVIVNPTSHGAFDLSNTTLFGFAFRCTPAINNAPPVGDVFAVGLGGTVDVFGDISAYPTGSQTPYIKLVIQQDSTLALISGNQQTIPPIYGGQFTILGPSAPVPICYNVWYWVELQVAVAMFPSGFDSAHNQLWSVQVGANYFINGQTNHPTLSNYNFGTFYKDIGPVQNKWPGSYANFVQFSANNANIQFTDFYCSQIPSSLRYDPFFGDIKQIACTDPDATKPCVGDPQDANIKVSQAALEVLILPDPQGAMSVSQAVIEWLKLPSPSGNLRVTQAVIELIKGNQRGRGWQVKEA